MKTLAAFITVLFAIPAVLACSCRWGGPFVEMASSDGAIVVVARVKEYRYTNVPKPAPSQTEDSIPKPHSPDAMMLEIESVLKGDLSSSELLVLGDNGAQCRPYVDHFPVGTRWAFVLHRTQEECYISDCGSFWLEEVKGKFKGVIEGQNPKRVRSITLDDLKKKIRAIQPVRQRRGYAPSLSDR